MIHRFCEAYSLSSSTTQRLLRFTKFRSTMNPIRTACKVRPSNQVKASRFELTLPLNFCKANELQSEPRLYFHDESLDRLTAGLSPGATFFLYGSLQCLDISLLLSVRAQLDPQHGGLGSKVIFIDAGNTFDPYRIAQYSEQLGLDRDRVLDRIIVSRAFTCHQLTSLITTTLRRALHERGAKLVTVSDMIELYRDPDIRNVRSLDLFKTTLNSLVTAARAERTIALATSPHEGSTDSTLFLHAIKERADIVLKIMKRRYYTKLILEKHPTRSEESLRIKKPTPRVLEEFLERDRNG